MARIAYWYREMSEYIEIDLRLLARQHTVECTGCPSRWPYPLATWRQMRRADIGWTWFASWHALVPALCARLQAKPFVVVVGGYDTAAVPAIGYGHQRGGMRRLVARAVWSLATRLVAISEPSSAELRAMGAPMHKVTLVPLALDASRYRSEPSREHGLVVTVGGVNRSNLTRKGLEPFVRAAALLPDRQFVVIGAWLDDAIAHLRSIATPNVRFTGRLTHDDKVAWLARAEVVVQASQHEAFGLSLAEGMLCGATPVVTPSGSLPWVTGGTGVIAVSADPANLAHAIAVARLRGAESGAAARARVASAFTLPVRAAALDALIDQVCGGAAPAAMQAA